ncbi:hypothetical protein TNIN_343301 [Trichonephila inaurata madagascariensis]|uniref:Uncharacterized protein n=1 Tax=Trichonephila inaurata madagascariensis TaxID=2747483 RepID=A0A8X6XB93_9ARAC|nr:hypothetical protein TNIN_343301 [Trichonephila inaurata madagascariensis]
MELSPSPPFISLSSSIPNPGIINMGEAGGGSAMRPHSQGTYRIAVSFPIDWGSPVRHSFAAARLLPIFSCSPPEFYKRHLFQENTSALPLSLLKVLNSSPPHPFQ